MAVAHQIVAEIKSDVNSLFSRSVGRGLPLPGSPGVRGTCAQRARLDVIRRRELSLPVSGCRVKSGGELRKLGFSPERPTGIEPA